MLDFVELNNLITDFTVIDDEYGSDDRPIERVEESWLLNDDLLDILFNATCPTDEQFGAGDEQEAYCFIKWVPGGGYIQSINIDSSIPGVADSI